MDSVVFPLIIWDKSMEEYADETVFPPYDSPYRVLPISGPNRGFVPASTLLRDPPYVPLEIHEKIFSALDIKDRASYMGLSREGYDLYTKTYGSMMRAKKEVESLDSNSRNLGIVMLDEATVDVGESHRIVQRNPDHSKSLYLIYDQLSHAQLHHLHDGPLLMDTDDRLDTLDKRYVELRVPHNYKISPRMNKDISIYHTNDIDMDVVRKSIGPVLEYNGVGAIEQNISEISTDSESQG